MTAIRSLLVANRGEIARRVMRTAHEMGIRTIAVYSEPDLGAPHVRDADLAIGLGGGSPRSYLDVSELLVAAERSGADAIHPGYGFLAENAEFAEAVVDAGLVWVGPPPEAIRVMGDKVAAKALAANADVPTLRHALLEGDEPGAWAGAVEPLGYPVVIKATAGGGGKGMYRVDAPDDLTDAVESARRVAASAFGDDTVFAEQWLATPRHIEIQVFADRAGNTVHLGERECSIQRRHQKILEESPSPVITPEMREAMGTAAVSLTRAVGYEGAGTVEFLFDGGDFWFLEMNTRLQVEHPVTEEVTGLDIVRLQLQVAAGDDLGFDQDDLDGAGLSGHAIEVRLYAEDPARDFLPCVGVLHRYEHATTSGIRYEDGVATGSEVTPLYDPMLAKMIAHAPTRAEAAARLARALSGMHIQGVTTNRDYLVRVLRDDDFLAGATFVTYVGDHPGLLDTDPLDDAPVLVGQVLAAALCARAERRAADPHWSFAPGGFGRSAQTVAYRWNPDRHDDDLVLEVDYVAESDTRFKVRVAATRGESEPDLLDDSLVEIMDLNGSAVSLRIHDIVYRFDIHAVADRIWVNSSDGQIEFAELPRFRDLAAEEVAGGPTAPMPGTVTSIEVAPGDEVIAGQTLVVLEAMKMEHRITVAAPAVVAEVLVAEGDTVDAHQLLVRLEEADD